MQIYCYSNMKYFAKFKFHFYQNLLGVAYNGLPLRQHNVPNWWTHCVRWFIWFSKYVLLKLSCRKCDGGAKWICKNNNLGLKLWNVKMKLEWTFSPYLVTDEYYKNYAITLSGLWSNMKGTMEHIWMILRILKPLNGIYGITKDNYTVCHTHSITYFKD